MTKREFFSELREAFHSAPDCVVLELEKEAKIRILDKRTDTTFCPVTFLAYAVTGRRFPMGSYDIAARELGLRSQTARLIAEAADTWNKFEYDSDTQRELSRALL